MLINSRNLIILSLFLQEKKLKILELFLNIWLPEQRENRGDCGDCGGEGTKNDFSFMTGCGRIAEQEEIPYETYQ